MNLSRVLAPLSSFVVLLALLFVAAAPAQAQTTWTGTTGNWATGGNWSNGVPVSNADAFINNGGTATLTGSGAVNSLFVGYNAAGSFTIDGGSLASSYEVYIGYSANGTASITSGSWNATSTNIYVGLVSGSSTFTISGGTVSSANGIVGHAGATGTTTVSGGSWTTSGDLSIGQDGGTGTLTLSGGNVTAGALRFALNTTSHGTLNLNSGVLLTAEVSEGTGSGGAHLNFNGGTLRASAANSSFFSGLDAGDVQLLAGGGTIDTNGHNIGIATAIQGAGSLTKTGTGTLTLSGASTYTGDTTISAGTLHLANSNNIVSSNLITVSSGGTLTAANFQVGNAGTGSVALSGGTISITGESYVGLNNPGEATITSGTWTSGGALYIGRGGSSGTLALSGGSLSAIASTIAGAGLDTGSGSATVSGGTWTTTNVFNVGYSGVGELTVSGGTVTAAELRLGNEATGAGTVNLDGGVIATAALVRGNGSASLVFNGGTLRATGNNAGFTTGFSAGDLQISAGGAIIDTQAHAVGFSAVLQGTGALTKQGSGTLTLSGTSTYTGATTISAGTLNLTGSIADSSLTTVASGAKLTGTGTLGALTVQNGGILAPGASPGTLNAGNTTFGPDGIFQFELNQAGSGVAGTNWDLLAITGTLAITATSSNPFVIDVASLTLSNVAGQAANFNSAASYTFIFATASGGITGFSADKFYIDTTDFANAFTEAWTVASDGNNLSLNYNVAVIPEPSTYAALAGLLVFGVVLWRRRRQAV